MQAGDAGNRWVRTQRQPRAPAAALRGEREGKIKGKKAQAALVELGIDSEAKDPARA